jgi:hypothetical protein
LPTDAQLRIEKHWLTRLRLRPTRHADSVRRSLVRCEVSGVGKSGRSPRTRDCSLPIARRLAGPYQRAHSETATPL